MNPMLNYQMVMNMARQMMQNPQQAVMKAFPDMPQEIQNNPNQIMTWLQQNGRINPQMYQMANQLMHMMGGK